MEKGGNSKCKEFFEKASEFHEGMTINERYSSDFAADYKEKVGVGYLRDVRDADRQIWLCLYS